MRLLLLLALSCSAPARAQEGVIGTYTPTEEENAFHRLRAHAAGRGRPALDEAGLRATALAVRDYLADPRHPERRRTDLAEAAERGCTWFSDPAYTPDDIVRLDLRHGVYRDSETGGGTMAVGAIVAAFGAGLVVGGLPARQDRGGWFAGGAALLGTGGVTIALGAGKRQRAVREIRERYGLER